MYSSQVLKSLICTNIIATLILVRREYIITLYSNSKVEEDIDIGGQPALRARTHV